MNKRYFVSVIWGCSMDGSYEKCNIGYANQEDEEHDGFNFVGRGGSEGADFFIVDSLEEAIICAHFNPYSIEFDELDEEDIILKDEILKKYEWDYHKGLVKKEGYNEIMTLEERYEKAAALIGKPIDYLKRIDADGPQCESSLPVCECILQDCCWITNCHFSEKWWEKKDGEVKENEMPKL